MGMMTFTNVKNGHRIMEPCVRSQVSGGVANTFHPLQEHLLGLPVLNLAQPENRLPFTVPQEWRKQQAGKEEEVTNQPCGRT